jgi:sporulation protein YlmC with PRC-barrel domain
MTSSDRIRIQLARQVLDKGVRDRSGLRGGKVDDLVLEIPDHDIRVPPRLRGLLTGPTAFAHTLPRPLPALTRSLYRRIGLRDPHPLEIDWRHVTRIGPTVDLDIDAAHSDIDQLADVVRRVIRHLPGATT